MKNIKIFLLTGFTLMSLFSNAQKECNDNAQENFGSDEAECRKNISLYSEYLRQGNYNDAIKYWRATYKICPEFKPSLYTNGQIMYKEFIDKETDAAKKEKLIDTLLNLYDQQIKIFGDCPDYYENKGSNMLKYRQKQPELSHNAFKKYIEIMKEKSSCVSIYGYYTTLYLLYRNKVVDCNQMVDDYMKLSGYLDLKAQTDPDNSTCQLARETLDKYAAGCLSCDKLIEIYAKKFEALPADKESQIKELNKMSGMLAKKECSGELVDKIAEKMYELEPSHEAAYALWSSLYGKKKYSDAMQKIKEAIELCGDCDDIAKYNLAAASTAKAQGNCSSAKSYALTTIAKDKDGKSKCDAYLIIASCIVASPCGDNAFERKFAYCLALDYLDKAKAAGCSVSSTYSSYLANCPTSQEAFTYGKKAGDPISSCGESTTLRISN